MGVTNRPANYKSTDLEPFRAEDDGHNIVLIKDWAPDDQQGQKLLLDNPAQLLGFDDSLPT